MEQQTSELWSIGFCIGALHEAARRSGAEFAGPMEFINALRRVGDDDFAVWVAKAENIIRQEGAASDFGASIH